MPEDRYLVLARKWRPGSFEEVVGQTHITRTLQNAITSGRIAHAFLFTGSRGVGKTTTARILAKALNCQAAEQPTPRPCGQCDNCLTIAAGTSMDVIEIDGASNNSVDHMRDVRDNIRLVPSRSRFKIYIIDEVHQLSAFAFNALLKTLEEPPPHAIFVLATTEMHKIPPTIVSRCQRYDFRRIGVVPIVELLRQILAVEGVNCTQEALYAIARAADGSMRDAESILDQLLSYCETEITYRDVLDVLGLVDWKVFHELCEALAEKDIAKLLEIVDDVAVTGKDLSEFVQDILRYFRNLLVCKAADARQLLALPEDELAQMHDHAGRFTLTELIRLVEQFAELSRGFDSQLAQRIALEALLIRISRVAVEVSVDTVLEKIMALRGGASPHVHDAPALAGSPESASPAAPAIELTESNLTDQWSRIVQAAAGQHLGLQVWLGQTTPHVIRGNTLVLKCAPGRTTARTSLEKPENRSALEEALRRLTVNVQTFQCEQEEAEPERNDLPRPGVPARPALGVRVSEEEARLALGNPHIAKVVEVFKGKIVDVKPAHP